MVETGVGADLFRKRGGTCRGNKELDLAFELLMFGPVEATQRVGASRR